jgi:hypothetical protein
MDAQNTLIQLGIMTGAVIGTGGLLPIPLGSNEPAGSWLAYQQARDRLVTAAAASQ